MNTLTEVVKVHRKKAKLTQAELAKLAGVGKTVVWDLENGKESVRWDTLQKIFRILNITVAWRSPLLDRTAAMVSMPALSGVAPLSSAENAGDGSSITESKPPV